MPMFCVVYGCSNRSNRETTRSFYRVPKVVLHKGEKCKKLTEKRREKWLLNLRSRGAESDNARVCSDHFVKGCPGALNDVESVDWAPTVNLGYQKGKPMSEALRIREERMKPRDDQHRHVEGAVALLDLHKSAEKPEDNTEMLRDRQDQPDQSPEGSESQSPAASSATPETAPAVRRTQNRTRGNEAEIERFLIEALKRPAAPVPPPPSEDELFFQSLVPSLARLPPQQKECRMKDRPNHG
ncbi:uncharacterized protein LOC127650670 isoform X2 [Xyrauchen texanus]|uniref:uncharacterized protein LOC127650670 isoform X2 n=1 Tax=Xyrauchen texanus TaxID=154827 RepID=UPI002241F77D|nr:uncharacterized protein LOC127650670 isoform X2 [Xyrauchen texanus]